MRTFGRLARRSQFGAWLSPDCLTRFFAKSANPAIRGVMFFLHRVPRLLFVATLLIAACGSDPSTTATPPPEPLDLQGTTAPFELGSVSAEYYEAVEYGPYEENLFDIYLPESDEPTPLLIYIHGGGFTGGSRDTSGSENRVLSYLAEGVAYASIDYRLLQSGPRRRDQTASGQHQVPAVHSVPRAAAQHRPGEHHSHGRVSWRGHGALDRLQR